MKGKKVKQRKPRLTFPQRLENALKESGLGCNVDHGVMGDNSSEYVSLKFGDGMTLDFGFNHKTKKLEDIGLYKDIVQVVDQDRIFFLKKGGSNG